MCTTHVVKTAQEVAFHTIAELISLGITQFYLSPGSRSSPMIVAAAHMEALGHIKTFVHFDERALGFMALGSGKATRNPACLIVTSGTAVANLLPAVIEACYDEIPLLILSADRPFSLRGCGANQTCNHNDILRAHCRYHMEVPDGPVPSKTLFTLLSYATTRTLSYPPGPVHLNFLFEEPLVEQIEPPALKIDPYQHRSPSQPTSQLDSLWIELIEKAKKGVIILGALTPTTDMTSIIHLAEKLGWPLLSSILSPGRRYAATIPFYETLLDLHPHLEVDLVLHIGGALVSKTLQEWLRKHPTIPYLQIPGRFHRQDPYHLVTHLMEGDPSDCSQQLLTHVMKRQDRQHLLFWQEESRTAKKLLNTFFENASPSTASLIFQLKDQITPSSPLFIGNSLLIREAERFFFPPPENTPPIFALRGVSGIDGNIATAIGIAHGTHEKVIALIGDQTFLYDLTSLQLLHTTPLLLCVFNNQGGRIFSSLPLSSLFPDLMDPFFHLPHLYAFEHAAALFHIPYVQTTNLNEALNFTQSRLIEITISPLVEQHHKEHLTCIFSYQDS